MAGCNVQDCDSLLTASTSSAELQKQLDDCSTALMGSLGTEGGQGSTTRPRISAFIAKQVLQIIFPQHRRQQHVVRIMGGPLSPQSYTFAIVNWPNVALRKVSILSPCLSVVC